MEEGQLLRIRAEAAIKEEEENERKKRIRNMENNIEVNKIN